MKTITFRPEDADKKAPGSRDLIRIIAETPQGQGITPDEMRKRIRILDALDAEPVAINVELEDADWSLLCTLTKNFKFGRATREILAIVDDILNAETAAEKTVAAKP